MILLHFCTDYVVKEEQYVSINILIGDRLLKTVPPFHVEPDSILKLNSVHPLNPIASRPIAWVKGALPAEFKGRKIEETCFNESVLNRIENK